MNIAFLRGINVSGKNKIPMVELKEMMKDLGCSEVKTYLNTGNVTYDKQLSEETIEKAIFDRFSLKIHVIVKSVERVKTIVESYTLSDGSKNSYVTMFKKPVKGLEPLIEEVKKEDDTYSIFDDYLCFYVPSGYGKTKVTNGYFEGKLKIQATTRNVKTLKKICSS